MESNARPLGDATAATVAASCAADHAPDWRALLEAEVKANKCGKAGVAIRLGIGRAYVSRALATGNTSAGFPNGIVPQQFIDRVIARLHVIRECPATMQPQPRTECQRIGNGPAPIHNPLSMRIWRECQQCPYKPSSTTPNPHPNKPHREEVKS